MEIYDRLLYQLRRYIISAATCALLSYAIILKYSDISNWFIFQATIIVTPLFTLWFAADPANSKKKREKFKCIFSITLVLQAVVSMIIMGYSRQVEPLYLVLSFLGLIVIHGSFAYYSTRDVT